MGVVIETCVKYPGGPTRNKGTDIHLLPSYLYLVLLLRISTRRLLET
jgi:hypothetical protein